MGLVLLLVASVFLGWYLSQHGLAWPRLTPIKSMMTEDATGTNRYRIQPEAIEPLLKNWGTYDAGKAVVGELLNGPACMVAGELEKPGSCKLSARARRISFLLLR